MHWRSEKMNLMKEIENPYDSIIKSIDRRIAICDQGIALANVFIYGSLGGLGLVAAILWVLILFQN